jgi:hypothetical protein
VVDAKRSFVLLSFRTYRTYRTYRTLTSRMFWMRMLLKCGDCMTSHT